MNKWLVAFTVMLPTLIEIVDTSVVNVSLGHIRGSLSASVDESTWSITSYLVSNAIIIPMTGWISRLVGRKKYLILSISLFTLSSLFCGLAWSLQSLVFFRVLQGLGGGALQPLSQSILLETFPPKEHGMAMAIFGVGIMFGPIVGPLLGGWITDNWSWRWIFYINIPIGMLSILMVILVIRDPHYAKAAKMRIDYMGLMLLALGLGCLQVVLDKGQSEDWFSSDFIAWVSVVSVLSLALFIIREFFAEHPIVDLRVFKHIPFTTGNAVMFFAFFNLFGSIVLLPIFLQSLMGYTATLAGLVLGPGGLATLIGMPLAGRLVTRVNPKGLLAFGIAVSAYSVYLMSRFSLTADFPAVIWPRVVLGVGMAFIFIPLTTLTLSGIKKEEMGNATGIYNLLRNLGGSFGVAYVTTVLSRGAQEHQARLVEGVTQFDPNLQIASGNLSQALMGKGFDPVTAKQGGLAVIYGELSRQAAMLSFNEVFFNLSVLMIAVLALLPLLKKGPIEARFDAH